METKTYIWLGIIIGGIVGGALGGVLDHGNMLGMWGILLSGVGSIAGIIAGYKISNS